MPKYIFTALILLLFACNNEKNKPKVSHIKVDIEIERFEKDFFKTDTNDLHRSLLQLHKKYPDFFRFYMNNMLGIELPTELLPDASGLDPQTSAYIKGFMRDFRPINDSIQRKYKNTGWLKDDIEQSFRYVKYYYPNYAIPKVITFISTFDAPGVVMTADYLGIGLHQFAGKDFSFYKYDQIVQMYPSYISRRFDEEFIVPSAMKAVVDDVYPDKSVGQPLIEQMVEKGKQWYLLDHFIPDAHDSLITGYTKKQIEWLEENEGNAWAYVIKNENLYTIEPVSIQTYLGEAPFTQGMPEVSPGNIGQWMGWKIVEEFAEKHPDIKLQELLQLPAKRIFEESGYRPK